MKEAGCRQPTDDCLHPKKIYPEIKSFDYSWSIVNDPQKAEPVESRIKELVSGRSNLGIDTIATHIEYEKMQSSIIFGSRPALSWLIFLFGVVNLINTTLSMAVCAEVSKKSFAGAVVPYQFPFLQMGLFLLVLFGMEVVLSVWMVRRQKKQSLVEQMRAQS